MWYDRLIICWPILDDLYVNIGEHQEGDEFFAGNQAIWRLENKNYDKRDNGSKGIFKR